MYDDFLPELGRSTEPDMQVRTALTTDVGSIQTHDCGKHRVTVDNALNWYGAKEAFRHTSASADMHLAAWKGSSPAATCHSLLLPCVLCVPAIQAVRTLLEHYLTNGHYNVEPEGHSMPRVDMSSYQRA